jgi:2-phospho-L-lactate/phosphoenolpyruvate guanylyltransferase
MSSQHSGGTDEPGTHRRWGAVVPAKRLSTAKSRLADLGDDIRRELVVAFLHDTVSGVLESARVRLVVVVTDDVTLARTADGLGAWPIPDGHGSDLNASLVEGVAEVERRRPGMGVVATLADLPGLRGADLDAWLDAEPTAASALVADEAGTGTTVLRARRRDRFRPAFGRGSRRAHVAAGVHDLTDAAALGLRRDVDTPADLIAAAAALRLGERTRWVLTRRGL